MSDEIFITAEEAEKGLTLKIKKGTVVRAVNYRNKKGTDVLFIAPKTGVYKIHGKIPQIQ